MGRSRRVLSLLSLAAALAIAPLPSTAQVLDQSQESWDDTFPITSAFSAWQVFTAARSGPLTSVEIPLTLVCFLPSCSGATPLVVEIVGAAGGVPTAAALGTALVTASPAYEDTVQWVPVSLESSGVTVAAGTAYAIHLSAGVPGTGEYVWQWAFSEEQAYAGGDFFTDPDASDGLDDPSTANTPNMDAAFRTFVLACGNGTEDASEGCDDGNTVSGDGCSAACVAESCGDDVVNDGAETCDDGNTVAGNGCDAVCALEPAALACRSAVAKSASRYASARLAALVKCRTLLDAGKTLSVADPAACASETAAAKAIAKAAAQARKGIAGGRKPKCTDALVAPLAVCGDTIDALVASDAGSGCLLAAQDAAVDALLTQYGY